ncbi:MAG: YqaJ viral recombinase family protein [Gammaproteobacteria bacterium]|nr:YqaJ viral recombinase family protein [Gammaproteobacteria bacterium]
MKKAFTAVHLEQGTPEWRAWRREGVGASDAPAIMGECPWKSADYLLREKCTPGAAPRQNAAMARGARLEPEARRRYMASTGHTVAPACLQSRRHEWLRASADGICFLTDALVEIKCGDSVYRQTARDRRVPRHYYGQLQHLLAVTGFEMLDFWCYLPNRPEVLLSVDRDEPYILRMLRAEEVFWERVQRGLAAPAAF